MGDKGESPYSIFFYAETSEKFLENIPGLSFKKWGQPVCRVSPYEITCRGVSTKVLSAFPSMSATFFTSSALEILKA